MIVGSKLKGWIRFRVRRKGTMVSIIMLSSVVGTFKSTMATRMSAREVFRH
jgi:hypothetical protein